VAFSLRCQGKKPALAQSEALRFGPLPWLVHSEALRSAPLPRLLPSAALCVGGFLTPEKRRALLCAKPAALEWRQREEGNLLFIIEIILERAKATPALQGRALTAALRECL
jgi:hypothetical protein